MNKFALKNMKGLEINFSPIQYITLVSLYLFFMADATKRYASDW